MSAAIGMAYGIVVWLIAQYAIWPAVDEAAAEAFTPWVFAIAHLMFGVVAALVISIPRGAEGDRPGRALASRWP